MQSKLSFLRRLPQRRLPEPRKPYAIGSTYSSIPSGCMK